MKEFTLLLFAHMLPDFYLQTSKSVKRKNEKPITVLNHAAVYALVMFATLALYRSRAYILAVIICAVSHAAIDLTKQFTQYALDKKDKLTERLRKTIFIVDQIMHLSIVTALSFYCASHASGAYISPFLASTIEAQTGVDGFRLLAVITFLLTVMRGASIFIGTMLQTGSRDEEEQSRLRYGSSIGMLERLIMAALLLLGQYAAIAIVFTAKSIVRFKDFDNREFAEYYLYGTLLSVAVCIGAFAVIRTFGTL